MSIRKVIAYPIFWVGMALTIVGTLIVGVAESIFLEA